MITSAFFKKNRKDRVVVLVIFFFLLLSKSNLRNKKFGGYDSRELDPIRTGKAYHVGQEASWLHFNPQKGGREKRQEMHQSYKPSNPALSDMLSPARLQIQQVP